MAYDIYGNYLRPGHCEVHPEVPELFPCYRCIEEGREREYVSEPPVPTAEDYCECEGHLYHGDDEEGGRCYCGAKRFPRGGPKDVETMISRTRKKRIDRLFTNGHSYTALEAGLALLQRGLKKQFNPPRAAWSVAEKGERDEQRA